MAAKTTSNNGISERKWRLHRNKLHGSPIRRIAYRQENYWRKRKMVVGSFQDLFWHGHQSPCHSLTLSYFSGSDQLLSFRRVSSFILCLAFASGTRAVCQFETTASFYVVSPAAMAVGDFDSDGKLDVAVGSTQGSAQLQIFLGRGDGTFTSGASYSSVIAPLSIVAADFNGDGKPDLAMATPYSDESITIMLGNGDGTFSQGPILEAASSPSFVAVGDFNHDGKLDVVAIETGPGCDCIAVFLGNGDGTFRSAVNTPVLDAIPVRLAVGDFNHDGKLDLALSEVFGGTNQVSIWLGSGDGTFGESQTYALGFGPGSVAAADLNRDGNLDLAISVFGAVSVLIGDGHGGFEPPTEYPVPFPGMLLVSNFSGDGKLDLAVACGFSPLSGACVLSGNGDGTFGPAAFYPVGPTQMGQLAVGDFNGDGKPDILAGDSFKYFLVPLLNTGVVSFSPTAPVKFSGQNVGTTSLAQRVTMTNTSRTPLKILWARVAGQFGMSSGCGSVLAPTGSCAINVTFSPKFKGAKFGTVTINSGASSKPMVIELSGKGT